ncbi:MAG: hypothetical protein K2P53_06075 [Rickettsiales bacterium]|jgi:hypothetical protein|nr:hypothetical protein [Rickettsiales bacterium]
MSKIILGVDISKKHFDVIIYIDKTSAIRPLEITAIWHKGEVFETFPSEL